MVTTQYHSYSPKLISLFDIATEELYIEEEGLTRSTT